MRPVVLLSLSIACGAQAVPVPPTAETPAPAALHVDDGVRLDMVETPVESAADAIAEMLGTPVEVAPTARGRRLTLVAGRMPGDEAQWALDQGLRAQGLALWPGARKVQIGVVGPPPPDRRATLVVRAADGNGLKLARLVDRLWRGEVDTAHHNGRVAIRGRTETLREVRSRLLERDQIRGDVPTIP